MRRGFSLFELLIAAALLSVLLTSCWWSFSSIRRAVASGRDAFEAVRRQVVLARRLEGLVAEASPYRQPGKDASFRGLKATLSFTTLRGKDDGSPPRLIRLSEDAAGLLLETSALGWLVDEAPESSRVVERFPGFRGLVLAYGDGRPDGWTPEWNAESKGALPRLVSVDLGATGDGALPLHLAFPTRLERDPSIP